MVPSSPADLMAPGRARAGARAVPFLLLADLARRGSEPRELEQRPYRPLFHLHLLRLLLLPQPPAQSQPVQTGQGAPKKKTVRRGGKHRE